MLSRQLFIPPFAIEIQPFIIHLPDLRASPGCPVVCVLFNAPAILAYGIPQAECMAGLASALSAALP